MPEVGYSRLGGQAIQPSTALPSGVNPRLELVHEGLSTAIKTLHEIRGRLGIPDPPEANKPPEPAQGTAGLIMMLIGQSQRLGQMLAETLQEIG